MEGLEEKLNSILGNPEMMSQLMTMAQSLGNQTAEPPRKEPERKPEAPPPAAPVFSGGLDPAMLKRIAGIAQQAGIDKNQAALLRALGPYLSRERIVKLEKAMRAAKIATVAASFLGSGGIQLFSGR